MKTLEYEASMIPNVKLDEVGAKNAIDYIIRCDKNDRRK